MNHLDAFKAAAASLSMTHGLRAIDERYEHAHFGDALLVLEGGGIRVRLLADRGQIFADIGTPSEPTKWYELRAVLSEIKGGAPSAAGPWPDVREAAGAIESNFVEIEKFLDAIGHGVSTSVHARH